MDFRGQAERGKPPMCAGAGLRYQSRRMQYELSGRSFPPSRVAPQSFLSRQIIGSAGYFFILRRKNDEVRRSGF